MPEFTRLPKTPREWLENVRSRGGVDAEWAHVLLIGASLDSPQTVVPAPTGDLK